MGTTTATSPTGFNGILPPISPQIPADASSVVNVESVLSRHNLSPQVSAAAPAKTFDFKQIAAPTSTAASTPSSPPSSRPSPSLGPQKPPFDHNFQRPDLTDDVQRWASSVERQTGVGCCLTKTIVRPIWGLFRMALHCSVGPVTSCFSAVCCKAGSLACCAGSACSEDADVYREALGGVARTNTLGVCIGCDSGRQRVCSAAQVLWEGISDAVGN